MVAVQRDQKDQPYIQWEQSGAWKRAWVQRKTGDADWAVTGRYLNVVRTDGPDSGPKGNPTDFPIYNSQLSDEKVLEAFVAAVCSITGCVLP